MAEKVAKPRSLARLLQAPLQRSHGVTAKVIMVLLEQRLQQQPDLNFLGLVHRAVRSAVGHPHADERQQLLDVERLRHVVVRAGCEASLLIVGHGLCRQHDDRQLSSSRGSGGSSRSPSRPSITGIMTSISTRSIALAFLEGFIDRLDGLAAISRDLHARAARFENAGEGENVPDVVLDDKDSPPFEQRVAVARLADHPLLFVRKVGDDLMQEQADLIEQPLGRFRALDDDRLRVAAQPLLFLAGEIAARVDDDRRKGIGVLLAQVSRSEYPDASGSDRSSTMQSKVWFLRRRRHSAAVAAATVSTSCEPSSFAPRRAEPDRLRR